jgi:phage baseplate assembly protein V
MMGPMQNAMRLQALRERGRIIDSLLGTITSYNPARYAAKVTLQPGGEQTGWLPVASCWIGNGWGFFTPPNVGDTVTVEFICGDLGAGTVTSRFWDNNQKPLSVPSGEAWWIHKSGQSIKLTNDGKLTITDGHGATIQLDGGGNIVSQATQWTHTGPVHFTDNVQIDKTLTANTDVVAGSISLKNHRTSGVQTGGGISSVPVV